MIFHIDMNAFFAMLEVKRYPEFQGLPVIVGGMNKRGVVATASYEARVFGVNSAMPMAIARRKCPEGVFLPADHNYYSKVSKRIMKIFYSYTPYFEPLSLDEAFLDVSGVIRSRGEPLEIAKSIQTDLREAEGLECSIGISSNKHTSKVASNSAKPKIRNGKIYPGEGIIFISPGKEVDFLQGLDVRAIWGVGSATFEKLQRYGIEKVGQIVDSDLEFLKKIVGDAAAHKLKALASGRDQRMVETTRNIKSMSAEETFPEDVLKREVLQHRIACLSDKLAGRLRASDLKARHLTLKIRYSKNFTSITRDCTAPIYFDTARYVLRQAQELLNKAELKEDLTGGVRLIGIRISDFIESGKDPEEELRLFDFGKVSSLDEWSKVENAIDEIRSTYKTDSISLGSQLYHNA